jgi:hypothetical protein
VPVELEETLRRLRGERRERGEIARVAFERVAGETPLDAEMREE